MTTASAPQEWSPRHKAARIVLSWRNWRLGNVLGQMLVTPLLLSLFAGHRSSRQVVGDALVGMLVLSPAMVTVAAEVRQVVGTIDRMKALLRNVQTHHRPVDLASGTAGRPEADGAERR